MSEYDYISEKKQQRVYTYIVAEYINELEIDESLLKAKVEGLERQLGELEKAIDAVKDLRVAVRCLKKEYVKVNEQMSKYNELMVKRRRTIEFLRGLRETANSVKLYCVTQKSGKQSYVKSDHIKLAEAMCTTTKDPSQSVVLVEC